MTERFYPSALDAGGDVTGGDYEQLAVDLFSDDGIIGTPGDPPLFYADSTGMHIKVRANTPVSMRGGRWMTDTIITKSVSSNGGATPRVDLAVIRKDREAGGAPEASPFIITGSGTTPPPPESDPAGDTGLWDFAGALVTVKPGATTIDPDDVVPIAPYVGRRALLVKNAAALPDVIPFGQIYQQLDKKYTWLGTGSGRVLLHQDTGWSGGDPNTVQVAEDWNVPSSGYGLYLRVVDRMATLVCEVGRTGALLTGSKLSVVAKIGSAYRPSTTGLNSGGLPVHFFTDGAAVINGRIRGNGNVEIVNYNTTIDTGQNVIAQTTSWPIG